jgi:hypothetical protein
VRLSAEGVAAVDDGPASASGEVLPARNTLESDPASNPDSKTLSPHRRPTDVLSSGELSPPAPASKEPEPSGSSDMTVRALNAAVVVTEKITRWWRR